MQQDFTFSMIKPDAVRAGNVGGIITMIENDGFSIKALTLRKLTVEEAAKFYEVHQARSFYKDMCQLIAAGEVMPIVLQKKEAVSAMRTLIGATNPKEAVEGTVRYKFGLSIDENAIHASDSDENALVEIQFFFPNFFNR